MQDDSDPAPPAQSQSSGSAADSLEVDPDIVAVGSPEVCRRRSVDRHIGIWRRLLAEGVEICVSFGKVCGLIRGDVGVGLGAMKLRLANLVAFAWKP